MKHRNAGEGTHYVEPATEKRKYQRHVWRGSVRGQTVLVKGRKGETKRAVLERYQERRAELDGIARPSTDSLAHWVTVWETLHLKGVAPRTRDYYRAMLGHLLEERDAANTEPTAVRGRRGDGNALVRLPLDAVAERATGVRVARGDRQASPRPTRLANLPLTKLTAEDLLVALERIERPATRRKAFEVLRICLNRAVRTGRLAKNPCSMIDPPRATARVVEPPTVEQVSAVLDGLRGQRDEALIVTALATGLRQGELVGLRWMDLERTTLHVRGQLDRNRNYVGAKRGSERVVNLPPVALDALETHRQRTALMTGGIPPETAYIFTDARGRPMTGYEAYRRWQVALRSVGIDPMPMHSARHFFASVQAGEQRDIVARLLGHKTVRQTAAYTHLMDDVRERATERIEKALNG